MFCIAAFVIFAILGIFSARYRRLAKKAWGCVAKKLTFRKCDIRFDEELKSKLLGKLIIRRPRLAKFLEKWISVLAFIFVVLSVWSLLVVFRSGLNLFVYDTCNPNNSESCSLGGEACGITRDHLGFTEALTGGHLWTWAKSEVKDLGQTFARIPDRLKHWDANEYLDAGSTYYGPFDPAKPAALEIIDPSCRFCAKMFRNIKEAGFEKKYNLAYIAYPIPDPKGPGGYKFPYSYLLTSYLKAIKKMPPSHPNETGIEADWQFLEHVFTDTDTDGVGVQEKLNTKFDPTQAGMAIQAILQKIGYDGGEMWKLEELASSEEVRAGIKADAEIVEGKIHTVKIPTIMFGGRRYDRVLDAAHLR